MYARPSKSLIFVRLTIAFVVVIAATVLTTVWLLTKDRAASETPEETTAQSNSAYHPEQTLGAASAALKDVEERAEAERRLMQDRAKHAEEASREFFARCRADVAALEKLAASMEKFRTSELAAAFRNRISEEQARVSTLRGREPDLHSQLTTAADAERTISEKASNAKALLATLRAAQHPLCAYLQVYTDFRNTVDKHNEASLELQDADRALGEAVTAYHDKRDELADLEAAVGDAMTSGTDDEKVATRAALANGVNALESARKARDEAQDRRSDIYEKVAATLRMMDTLAVDLVHCREKLDSTDAETAKLLKVLEGYESALGAKAKAARAVKAATDELMRWERASNDPSREFAAKKETYLQAHREWLAASKALTVLLKKDGFSGVTQDQIDRAQDAEQSARSVDRRAKADMNEARKRMDADRAEEMKLRRSLAAEHAKFKAEVEKLAPAAAKVGEAVDRAMEAMGPVESERLKQVEEATQAVSALIGELVSANRRCVSAQATYDAAVQERVAIEATVSKLKDGQSLASSTKLSKDMLLFVVEFKRRSGTTLNKEGASSLEELAYESISAAVGYAELHALAFPDSDSWGAALDAEEILDRLAAAAEGLSTTLPE